MFLDIDGTLLDFAHHPDAVQVDARLHDDLAHMRVRLGGAVALLSGRPLAQLDALFDWHGQPAAGLHGAELRGPDGREHHHGDAARLATLRSQAAALATATPDVLLEDKRLALALHYRHAPHARAAAEGMARVLLETAGDSLVAQRGDHVIELKPAGVDKGRALAALMQHAPLRGRSPWMLGDDLTDEDAFRIVNERAGVSVIVGPRRPTRARHALAGPAQVREWLHAQAARAAPARVRTHVARGLPTGGSR